MEMKDFDFEKASKTVNSATERMLGARILLMESTYGWMRDNWPILFQKSKAQRLNNKKRK
ncbi:MAG: hypothetical protein WC776_04910 [Patescibacteria group bacterium]|jgi:hypothetical protein